MTENDKICREKIHELLDVVLDINSVHERCQESTGNLPTAFFWFSGHIGSVSVDIHLGGWHEDAKVDYEVSAHTDDVEELDAAASLLRRIAIDGEKALEADKDAGTEEEECAAI